MKTMKYKGNIQIVSVVIKNQASINSHNIAPTKLYTL